MTPRILVVAASFALVSAAHAQQQTPLVPLTKPGEAPAATKQPEKAARTKLYDESADAKTQIAAALAKAKKNNTRVLIQWGGNWCGWCIRLHELCKSDKALAKELSYEYEVVHVDTGQPKGKNLDLAKSYGADVEKFGFPFLTVLDANGKALANQETEALEMKKDGKSAGMAAGHDPAAMLAFLKSHEAKPVKAEDAYDGALAEAKKSGKRVFLHFGAPWCGFCHKLEAWTARPEVAAILGKEFIDLKIDTDRMPGGKEMFVKLAGSDSKGIPWLVFLDESGKALANSDAASGNVGFPIAPEEILHFEMMLNKSAKTLGAADIETLITSLRKPVKPPGT